MNVAPQYTLDAVESIVTHEAVRIAGLLLTLKLPDWSLVAEIPSYLARIRSWGYAEVAARQLHHNRHEFCVAARNLRPAKRQGATGKRSLTSEQGTTGKRSLPSEQGATGKRSLTSEQGATGERSLTSEQGATGKRSLPVESGKRPGQHGQTPLPRATPKRVPKIRTQRQTKPRRSPPGGRKVPE